MDKILVIDDDSTLRQTIRMVLMARGYEVVDADSGMAGVKVAREERPNLVISDVNMPDSDGYAALDALRKDPITANIPFIFMTGDADESGMRRGMEGGADDYLPKPFSMESLLATVDARLKKVASMKKQAERQLAELRSNLSLMLPHELNTPLIGILGFGEIISTCADSLQPSELVEMGQSIVLSGQRLQRLIQNFLLYAQIELLGADAREISMMRSNNPIPSSELITELAQRRAETAKRPGDLKLDLCNVNGAIATELLSKIVEELVDNAFKFSEPGQRVSVVTRMDGRMLELTFTDAGRGFKPEHVNEVSAYMQFERKMHEQQGSGLGLVIVKRLAEIHGGVMRIQSDGKTGTTVVVRLPASAT